MKLGTNQNVSNITYKKLDFKKILFKFTFNSNKIELGDLKKV